jgi:SAM-dependent methyltransferase
MIDTPPTDPATERGGRVLALILTHNAEPSIRSVMDQIPAPLLNSEEIHFLVLDDASEDMGVEAALSWVAERNVTNFTVLRNGVNQGYGGNQKLGFRLAIDCAFDFAVVLHGDGRYSPTFLQEIIDGWRRTAADVVINPSTYETVGSRSLTRLQSLLTGESLAEYHAGQRGYTTAFLRSVPFDINTNDFHFDTEVLLQAFHTRSKVVELKLPRGHRKQRRQIGLKYAYDVLKATLQFRLQQRGMFCSLKYPSIDGTHYADKTRIPYSSHRMALELVQAINPRRVLDIGCGAGFVARECEKAGASVTGLDKSPPQPDAMSEFISAGLDDDSWPVNISDYDLVLLLDVIEHLNEPEQFLIRLRESYASLRGTAPGPPPVILSTPNVAFVTVRLNLLLGKFPYAERGILDVTHRRLFTRGSLLRMLVDCGYQIEKVLPVPVPFDTVFDGWLGPPLTRLSRVLCAVWPRLFAFQFMVLCRPRPGARQLLTESEQCLIAEEDFYRVLQPHDACLDDPAVNQDRT